jgi:uncharacterized membrane protein
VLGVVRHENLWWSISFWNIALGLAAALVTALAGFVDYVTRRLATPPYLAFCCFQRAAGSAGASSFTTA